MSPHRLLPLLLLVGCGEDDCPAGSSRQADGLCHLDDHGGDTGVADDEDDGTGGGDEGGGDEGGGTGGDEGGGDEGGGDGGGTGSEGIGFLGGGTHSVDSVEVTAVVTSQQSLSTPRDLAFDPEAPTHLWITERNDDAMVIVTDPNTASQVAWKSTGSERHHWLAKPSAIAFGAPGFAATAHDDDGGVGPGQDASFQMGPSLWPTDLLAFDGGRPSHLDMVHDPANMQGIAWQEANVYWIHDGWNGCLTRMDFAEPHEPGGTFHSDADVDRFICGDVGYLYDVPAHMEWDHDAGRLYFNDPETASVRWLDPSTATEGENLRGTDSAARNLWTGETQGTVLAGDPLQRPSGLALHEGLILVSDPITSRITALTPEGEIVDWLDTGLEAGSLGGIEVGPDGALWVVDKLQARVLRYAAP